MSAILSADDLSDFISPGVACIKPVETLPQTSAYEVTTEDQLQELKTAQISLTDCLACSGCVTSAEAVLVSLQSHNEVLSAMQSPAPRIFVASISPQARASLAAAFRVSTRKIGHMIDHLLLSAISSSGRAFDYVLDTEPILSICLHLAAKEVIEGRDVRPILTSDCPGFICYLEKTHPQILPHLSRLKSPQAILGTLLKTMFRDKDVYHAAVMPCFDKKLEASRQELTDAAWKGEEAKNERDVDCVITTKELLLLAEARGVDFKSLPKTPLHRLQLFELLPLPSHGPSSGTSGGYLAHILAEIQSRQPSTVEERKGRNADVVEYAVIAPDGTEIAKLARYYGFRNIQNLVRKMKPKPRRLPAKRQQQQAALSLDYTYVEVMACPGGCTNGGGQLKPEIDVTSKEWLAKVDEAYFSDDEATANFTSIDHFLQNWSDRTGIPLEKLVYTTYRAVESDVGKKEMSTLQAADLASKAGGGW